MTVIDLDAAAYRLMFGRLERWPGRSIGDPTVVYPMTAEERTDRLAAVAAMRAEASAGPRALPRRRRRRRRRAPN